MKRSVHSHVVAERLDQLDGCRPYESTDDGRSTASARNDHTMKTPPERSGEQIVQEIAKDLVKRPVDEKSSVYRFKAEHATKLSKGRTDKSPERPLSLP